MELTAGLKIVGVDLTDEEAEQFHTHCDLNGDGHISLQEFTDAVGEAKAVEDGSKGGKKKRGFGMFRKKEKK